MLSIDGLLSANFAATAATHTDGKQQHQLSALNNLSLSFREINRRRRRRSAASAHFLPHDVDPNAYNNEAAANTATS